MPWNINASYGRLAAEAIQNAVATGGRVLLVSSSQSDSNYEKFSSMLPSDPDGKQRFFSGATAVQDAVTASEGGQGDVVALLPGSYDEAVTVPLAKWGLTIVGLGTGASIAPSATAAIGLTINAQNVSLINLGVAGGTTATYALRATGNGLKAIGCKFEGADTSGSAVGFGPGSVAAVTAGTAGHGGDAKFLGCEFAWSYNGLALVASDYGAATQVEVKGGLFHNLSNIEIIGVPGAFGIGSARNLEVTDSVFDNMEDGTAPSDFVKVDDALDTGIFSGNRFALATNAAANLKIGAGVLWVANATEAGWSTARPS